MNENFKIAKEEEMKKWDVEQLKKYSTAGIKEAKKILNDTKDFQKAREIVESVKIAQALLEEKQKEVVPDESKPVAKKDVQTEKRSYLSQIDDAMYRGVTSSDIPVVEGQSKLKLKDTFDISNHVTNESTKHMGGKLPTISTDEALANEDELRINPDLNKLKFAPEANKYFTKTFRGQLGLSFEMMDDAYDTPAYIDGIGQSILRNTKLKELISKATSTQIADKPALINAINGFNIGNLKLVANKQNLNRVGAMADQIIFDNGKLLYRLGGTLVEAVEAPKTMESVLLFNKESTHIISRYVNYRLVEPSSGQLYYAKLLKITMEMTILLEEPVLNLTF